MFYKGVDALSGAMLLDSTDLIAQAAVWQRRQGGTLYAALSNIISARSRLMPQLAKMDGYRAQGTQVAAIGSRFEGADVLPSPSQVNQFHRHLRGERAGRLNQRGQRLGIAGLHGFRGWVQWRYATFIWCRDRVRTGPPG